MKPLEKTDIWWVNTLHDTSGRVAEPVRHIPQRLRGGQAVLGWSWTEEAQDLRRLKKKVDAGDKLGEAETAAVECLPFLDFKVGDVVVYTKQPSKKNMMVVVITGEYEYSRRGLIGEDYRSYMPCVALDALGYPAVKGLPARGRGLEKIKAARKGVIETIKADYKALMATMKEDAAAAAQEQKDAAAEAASSDSEESSDESVEATVE